ncbi:MAG: cell wall hydrolase [Sphingomonadaceae bacterium]|nr:cell wall hydrolase [Sphingomonadaceae bacterium]
MTNADRRRRSRRHVRQARAIATVARTQRAALLVMMLAVAASIVSQRLWPPLAGFGPPPVSPLTPAQARAINAAMPFASDKLASAKPFMFRGTPAARLQATDCLATAAIYEAGDDADGQRAVMQVVLNRVRAPGFPKTVCGVVYAGADRATGCQFSFTCDGSIARRPEHSGWNAARARARQALSGAVFADVGTATHYHADWVAPSWSRSLDKVAKIRSHIFYQQPGSRRTA